MKITIEHPNARYTPRWETLEAMVNEVLTSNGKFTRISRTDRGCDYRAMGDYIIDHRTNDSVRQIHLTVTRETN